jgi:hypothetical protein
MKKMNLQLKSGTFLCFWEGKQKKDDLTKYRAL